MNSLSVKYGTIYAAKSLEVCFGETLLRGDEKTKPLVVGTTFLAEAELQKRVVVALSGAQLKLAVLAGVALKNLGGDAGVSSMVSYAIPQQWSKTIYQHPEDV